MVNRILVPVDHSDHSRRAVSFATELAVELGASVRFVHILSRVLAREQLKRYVAHLRTAPEPDMIEIESVEHALAKSGESEALELLERVESSAQVAGVQGVDTLLVDGDPAALILKEADRGDFDLIVLGRRGMGGLKSLLVGSVSQKVAAEATCPVVLVN